MEVPNSPATVVYDASPFKKHLAYPDPMKHTRKQSNKENLLSAISSAAWRMYYEGKDETRRRKMEDIKKRKEDRLLAKEKNLTENTNKKSAIRTKRLKTILPIRQRTEDVEKEENNPAHLSEQKGKIHCADCTELLESDIEEDDEKNIGCDHCPRWYHMKCTEFIGNPYEEAAELDYSCDYCT